MRANVRAYNKISRESGVLAADPHRVILMLMQGLLDSVATAKGCIQRKDFEGKAIAINKAINIVAGLQDGINMDVFPEIGNNFYQLYDYVIRRLSEADSSGTQLDEVYQLIAPLRDAWANISEAEKQEAEELRTKMANQNKS